MRWKQFFIPAKSMSAEEARDFMAAKKVDEYTLLDVRQPGEYEKARIPGGVLIPLPELTDRLDELPSEKPIIVY